MKIKNVEKRGRFTIQEIEEESTSDTRKEKLNLKRVRRVHSIDSHIKILHDIVNQKGSPHFKCDVQIENHFENFENLWENLVKVNPLLNTNIDRRIYKYISDEDSDEDIRFFTKSFSKNEKYQAESTVVESRDLSFDNTYELEHFTEPKLNKINNFKLEYETDRL